MSLFDAFRYDGKRALVVGGATGMGAATAELVKDAGAEVVVMDRAEVTLDGVKAISLDLSDKASIDVAVDECGEPVHALFSWPASPMARPASNASTSSATAT
jgi:NAD(P)-dependent dehydrogenase (short-subunit alcohol dehydrogenase family)